MTINRDNLKWAARLMAIMLVAGVADTLAVAFLRHPFPWTVLIPCSIPVLTAVFVILPLTRAAKG
jgi:hypothetical protein